MPEDIPKVPCVIPGAAAVIPSPTNSRECVVVRPDTRFDERRVSVGVFALCSDGEWRGVRGRGLSFPASILPQLLAGLASSLPVS